MFCFIKGDKMANIRVHTLFRWCNDVAALRRFYSDVLQLDETFYRDDEKYGWLTYQVGGVQLVFMRASQPMPLMSDWAKQPGYGGGSLEVDSLLLVVDDTATLEAYIARLQAANIPLSDQADASRQCVVRDPMGWTVEIALDMDKM
jgi:catechol 2,3-dioxygenase-like lactoylglutathione lyase family enzyme